MHQGADQEFCFHSSTSQTSSVRVPPVGLEPTACCLEGSCSIQLSYGGFGRGPATLSGYYTGIASAAEVDDAVEWADKSPWPDPATLTENVYENE